jgi:hypothetical protein
MKNIILCIIALITINQIAIGQETTITYGSEISEDEFIYCEKETKKTSYTFDKNKMEIRLPKVLTVAKDAHMEYFLTFKNNIPRQYLQPLYPANNNQGLQDDSTSADYAHEYILPINPDTSVASN